MQRMRISASQYLLRTRALGRGSNGQYDGEMWIWRMANCHIGRRVDGYGEEGALIGNNSG